MAEIVARLDGLPLAVELAAARIRTMSADEVRRALDDRFALLRSRDRSAPARHQTLTAVIAWSWDLLTRRGAAGPGLALGVPRRVHRRGRAAVLRAAGPDLVEALVDQSLLTVAEHDGATRYRMLETVREFGAQRLVESGQADAAAHDAQTAWAVALATWAAARGVRSATDRGVDALAPRRPTSPTCCASASSAGDAARAVPVLAAQGGLWAITGNHPRFFALADLAQRCSSTGSRRSSCRR